MNQVGYEKQWLHLLNTYVRPLQEKVFTGYFHIVCRRCFWTEFAGLSINDVKYKLNSVGEGFSNKFNVIKGCAPLVGSASSNLNRCGYFLSLRMLKFELKFEMALSKSQYWQTKLRNYHHHVDEKQFKAFSFANIVINSVQHDTVHARD